MSKIFFDTGWVIVYDLEKKMIFFIEDAQSMYLLFFSLSEKESILEGCRNQVADLNEHVSNLSAEKSDLEQKLVQLTNTITK